MTDQDDFRPPRKPPWPFQQTQHQYMQSDSETAKQRIQKPPRTSKTSKTTNRQPTTARTTPTTARRFKQVQAERRTPKTRTGTQSKQHLPSRTRSACDITKNQDKPILLHGATRCGTVWPTPQQARTKTPEANIQQRKDTQNPAIKAMIQTNNSVARIKQEIQFKTQAPPNPERPVLASIQKTNKHRKKHHEHKNNETCNIKSNSARIRRSTTVPPY
jgi:hypothetical protein